MMRSKLKKKKWYDDDADLVPQKGRQFVMRKAKQETEEPEEETTKPSQKTEEPEATPQASKEAGEPKTEQKIKNDAEGLSRAYAQDDVFGQDDKMYVAGSHTIRDWFDDVTKIPQWQYVPPGISDAIDFMNTPWGRWLLGTGDLRQSERYRESAKYLLSHPKVTTGGGHSLGGAVVLQLQKDFPDRLKKRSRIMRLCGIR